jgi:CheY-like chemotaxis protein/ABC-type phosphate/phosphonate transport system substrate-binding protein
MMTGNNMKNFLIKRINIPLVFIITLSILMSAPISQADDTLVKIGVLAKRGPVRCMEKWSPTAEYLTARIPGKRFVIIPLGFDGVVPAVGKMEIDFILSNSMLYVEMEHLYSAVRIATLRNRHSYGISTQYGGVIFCRADRTDIRSLKDLKRKIFMAVAENSFGGWIAPLREMKKIGIKPNRDFARLDFADNHDAVVYAVRDKDVDAGSIRTNTLERMNAEGKIDLKNYRVLSDHLIEDVGLILLHSTRAYPEWPMATLRHTSGNLAEKVATALVAMPSDSPAAVIAKCTGWTIPLNYQPVHECLKELKLVPYKHLGEITFAGVYKKYRRWILLTGFLFVMMTIAGVFNIRLNLKLKKAKDESESSSRSKSEFLANISHEIRTPMNGILGFADILLEDELPQEHRDAIQTIKKSGETLMNLINDILDLSKVESNNIELEAVPFNVEDLILDVAKLSRTNLGEKQLEINCHIGDIHTNFLGDPTRLRQIITNLTGNAIKFTQEGEIVISVATEKEDDKQTTLKFFVRDTGIGIPEDKLDTIFESFKQADGSTTREYGGTGLGLTISKKFVQLMGGDMWVESGTGKGSIFYFTAVFNKELDASKEFHPVDVSQLEEKPILIVDDNETALKIVADMVTRVGMAPVLARSGEKALEYFRLPIADLKDHKNKTAIFQRLDHQSSIINHQSTIELAIIDIMMPEMSGHELAKKISELTGGRTKMIALSSNAAIGFAAESQRSGFAGFMPKPVRRNVLIDMIRTVMGIGEKNLTGIVTQHSVKETISHDVKILYAEDNPVNQKLGLKMLERMGYKAEIASDGAEAVRVVKEKGPYDIIFMDIQMPNMDGIEATKEIRKLETGDPSQQSSIVNRQSSIQRLPIIALTANAMKGDREKYLEAGMDDYLSKPFKREDIQRVIRELVHKGEVQAEALGEMRILVVEDEENMRKSIIRFLRREMPAAKVITAEDGIDATAKLGSFMPDLILADIRMPGMDGSEFIHYIRKTGRYAHIKLIVMTALHEDDPRVAATKEAGIDAILYRPCDDNELILAIRDTLSS